MRTIIAKIDLRQIDKKRVFIGKNGAEWVDIVLLENRDGTDKYGNDFMAVQGVSKEEREQKIRGPILGNAKEMKPNNTAPQRPVRQEAPKQAEQQPVTDEDPPF